MAARREIGHRLVTVVLDLLDVVTRAHYSRDPAARLLHLDEANATVAFLRLLLRGARELRLLAPDQHGFASERLDGIGRQVGAWRRSLEKTPR